MWRLDNSLLGDDTYVEEISNLLQSLTTESVGSNPSAEWEWIKFRIREKTMEFETKRRRSSRRKRKN